MPTTAEQLKRVQAQQARLEAQFNQLNVRAQRSVTSAAEVGRNTMNSTFWPDSCQPRDLWNILHASDAIVAGLVNDVICKLPASLQECAQLESDFRNRSKNCNKTNQKRPRDSLSASSLDILAAGHVQLGWGYVLRQLQQVGAQYVRWYLHDTSHSGITGHSGKVDYCMTADTLKAWPQVVALTELTKELASSLYTECVSQLSARCLDIFDQQPHRKHAVVIAGAQESMEVLVFYKDFRIVRSGLQAFSLATDSSGLRWLVKALFSSLPSMGFIPEILPLNGFTPLGTPVQRGLYCRADAPTSTGPGLSCKVFQVEYGLKQHPAAMKIGASVQREAKMLEYLADVGVTGVPEVVEYGNLPGNHLPFIITQPFGTLLAFGDDASLVVSVMSETASIISRLASLETPVLHRDISIGNIVHHGDAHEACLIDFGTAVKAPAGSFTAVTAHRITGTSTFMARRVPEGGAYTLSSELESLMYVIVFLAADGAAHWGKKPIGHAALAFKVQSFGDHQSFERFVVQRCCPKLVKVVRRLRNLFWQPEYHRSVTEAQFQQALQDLVPNS